MALRARRTAWLAIVGICIAAATGLGSSSAGWAQAKPLVIAEDSAFSVLDPASAGFARTESEVVRHVFNNLVRYDFARQRVDPELATSWSVSDDGLRWTFKLRTGVKFQDGTAFSAQAVKYTFDRLLDPKKAYASRGVFAPFLSGTRVIDSQTVEFDTRFPFGPMLTYLSHTAGGIVSPAAADKWGDDFAIHPVGTGPYSAIDISRGVQVTLKRNPDYFGPAPKTDQITLRMIVDDGARVAALQAGQADIATSVPAQDVDRLKRAGITIVSAPSLQNQYLGINTTRPGLGDVRVRQALNYAVDKQAISRTLFQNFFAPLSSLLPAGAFGYAPQPAFDYDAAKAKQLLADAGYGPGKPFRRLILWTPEGMWPKDIVVAQAIQAQLRQAGLDVDVQRQERGSYYTSMHDRLDFDLFMFAFIGSTGDGYQTFFYLLKSDPTTTPENLNFTRYKNPRLDDLIAGAATSVDQPKRKYYLEQAQKLSWQEAPYVWLYNIGTVNGYRRGITGIQLTPLRFMVLTDAVKQ
jgi:peptide/nickel transport system substrate-binding protein